MGWLRRFLYSDDPEVKLASGLSELEAKMWQELLAKNGIHTLAKSANFLSAYQVAPMPNDYDIWVKQSDLERAREILEPMLEEQPQ